jgi:hypothetical protein
LALHVDRLKFCVPKGVTHGAQRPFFLFSLLVSFHFLFRYSFRIFRLSGNLNRSEVKMKLGLVGDSGAGKTCLLLRFVENSFFEANDRTTIGVDFKEKLLNVEGRQVRIRIYDTAGQVDKEIFFNFRFGM